MGACCARKNSVKEEEANAQIINNSKANNKKGYESWTTDDIISWILSLNDGQFKKYQKILNKELSAQNVSGRHLVDVNELDIHTWGVTDFDDKKYLLKQIKLLITSHNKNDDEIVLYEAHETNRPNDDNDDIQYNMQNEGQNAENNDNDEIGEPGENGDMGLAVVDTVDLL